MKDVEYFDAISINKVQDQGISKNNVFYQHHANFQANFINNIEDKILCDGAWDAFLEEILAQKYKKVDVK